MRVVPSRLHFKRPYFLLLVLERQVILSINYSRDKQRKETFSLISKFLYQHLARKNLLKLGTQNENIGRIEILKCVLNATKIFNVINLRNIAITATRSIVSDGMLFQHTVITHLCILFLNTCYDEKLIEMCFIDRKAQKRGQDLKDRPKGHLSQLHL